MEGRQDVEEETFCRTEHRQAAPGGGSPGAGTDGWNGLPRTWDLGAELKDELLNGEVFYTLKEARVLIEQWRWYYNTIRPQSALRYRPPAPAAILPDTNVPDYAVPWPPLGGWQPRQTLS